MKNIILFATILISGLTYSQSQRFEYDSVNLCFEGDWLPKKTAMENTVVLNDEFVRIYTTDSRSEFKIVQRHSRDEIELPDNIALIFAGLYLDEENKEVYILITDEFMSYTYIENNITVQFSD